MKRIGILTHPLGRNYGGILQAWALQQILIKLGFKPQTLDWDYNVPTWYSFFRGILSVAKAIILRRSVYLPTPPYFIPKKYRGLRGFVKKNILLSSQIRFDDIIPFILKHYHTIIVGSDQVWRAPYIPDIATMFLPYDKSRGHKKIAYAASFGTDNWEYSEEQTKVCAILLSNFDAVGVREKSGVELCSKKLDFHKAKWVLDPTLLLDRTSYDSLCSTIEVDSNGYVVAYILDNNPELLALAKKKAEELILPLKVLSVDNEIKSSDTVEKWLASFRDAKYIVTDSFHGTVFSLIYHKEFAVHKNQMRGNARFDSLCQLFPLINERLIDGNKLPHDSMDWRSIESNFDLYRRDSIDFLKCALM